MKKAIFFITTILCILVFDSGCGTILRSQRCYKAERVCQDKCSGTERQIRDCDEMCYMNLMECLGQE